MYDLSGDTKSWSIKDIDFESDGDCWDGVLNFELSIVLLMLHYGDIIFFPSKFKFDHVHIFTSFLISEQKIMKNCLSDTLIFLKCHLWMLRFFTHLEHGWT